MHGSVQITLTVPIKVKSISYPIKAANAANIFVSVVVVVPIVIVPSAFTVIGIGKGKTNICGVVVVLAAELLEVVAAFEEEFTFTVTVLVEAPEVVLVR